MKYASLMNEIGTVKMQVKSWKDVFSRLFTMRRGIERSAVLHCVGLNKVIRHWRSSQARRLLAPRP
jgi:hypothetical protein